MARKSKKSNVALNIVISILVLLIGAVGGFIGYTYFTLPLSEELVISEDVFYSYNESEELSAIPLTNEPGEVSVHFLELGNKYTGDCTYIKVGDIDILIDCGSKSNSISTVSEYLNQYVTDNTLEYVIITHAHTDHYAGFATSEKVQSIFDLYECETIITFSQITSGKDDTATYKNYLRELNAEIEAGAEHFTALECVNESENENGVKAQKVWTLNAEYDVTLEILDSYYYENRASSENDHSVCVMINQGTGEDAKHFLFTGDLEADGEEYLVQLNELPQVDLYKAGHHGSKTSSTDVLLDAIQPKTVCICCCAGSSEYTDNPLNQFPTQEFIDRMAIRNIENIYVTTLCVDYDNNEFTSFNGNIVVISLPETSTAEIKFGVNCSNNNTILKDSEWFKNNRVWNTATA